MVKDTVMIEVFRIRIQTINGQLLTRQEAVSSSHTFQSKAEMEAWRTAKEMKLQYKANIRHKREGGGREHEPKVYVALSYREKGDS